MTPVKYFLTLLLAIVLSLTAALPASAETELDFRTSYESLNGEQDEDGRTYKTVTVPDDFPVIEADQWDIMQVLDSGTGVIYFGFPECPWCRTLLPVLFSVYENAAGELPAVYSYDLRGDRDSRYAAADGTIVTEDAGSAYYRRLLYLLKDRLGPYEGLDRPELLRIYMPTLVFVKDGTILAVHIGTLDSQTDGCEELNEEQIFLLSELLRQDLALVCDDPVVSASR